ncbi:hypothetical protein OIU77_027558, partial [Salix suchowensis]
MWISRKLLILWGRFRHMTKQVKVMVRLMGLLGCKVLYLVGTSISSMTREPESRMNKKIFSNDYYSSQKQVSVTHQSFQSNQQFSYAPNTGRSSAGRPPHALVTFGFGGKLIVMKDGNSLRNSSFDNQGHVGGSISVMNLMEVLSGSSDNALSVGGSTCSYFRALCQQSFPGPLVGGSFGNKELNKWIDERIAHCELCDVDHTKGKALRLLLSLLKIACQHYGKLRSPFGSDILLK